MTTLDRGMVAVVTGAAKGIGKCLAQAFANRGLHVVLADSDEIALRSTERELAALGARVLGASTDVSKLESVAALREATLKAFGRVDILCNNAGIYFDPTPIWTADISQWKRLIETNYWSVVFGIHEFVPHFVSQGFGHVVNTASMSGLTTVPGIANYGSAKHAVIAISETLRTDLDHAGHEAVGVTVLCPALVRTQMGERALGSHRANNPSVGSVASIQRGSGPNLAAIIEPETVANLAIEGIEKNRLYVFPTPGSRERFDRRTALIAAALDDYS